jgi:DNA repair protein SbcC/Rad50
MLPIRLEIRNFLAYRSPDPVYFEGIHLACLTGANGAGKSSLLDAITWVLWGKARAKRDEELVHLGQSDMYIQLDFEQEGARYRVLRQRTRKSGGIGKLELFSIADDGTFNPLTEANMKSTQNKIDRLLRLDYETFVHSAFLQQGRADAFTVKTPRERKQILSDMLGLSRWEQYEDLAKEELKKINNDLTGYEALLQNIESELRKEPQLKVDLDNAQTAHAEAQAALEAAEKLLAGVAHADVDLRNAQARQAEHEARIKNYARDLKQIADEIARQRDRIAAYEQTIAERAAIEGGYNALQSARATDHALGDVLMQLSDLDAQANALQLALQAEKGALESEFSALQAEIGTLERTMAVARPAQLADVQAEIAALQAMEAQRDYLQAQVNSMAEEQASLTATNTALKSEMDAMHERLSKLEVVSGAACPLCGQPLTEDHRAQLIDEVKAEGKQRGDHWRENRARLADIVAQLKTQRASVDDLSLDVKKLPPLLELVGRLQADFDAASAAGARRDVLHAQATALHERIESEAFGEALRKDIDALADQRMALGYDGDKHTAVRQDLQVYQQYEAQQTALNIALSALPEVQEACAGAQLRLERLEKAQTDEQVALDALLVEIAGLKVRAQEQLLREEEARAQRAAERTANNRAVAARQELVSLENQRTRQANIEKQRIARQQDRARYDELAFAFGKKGVPAMIIEAAVPELEISANRLLGRMTDGRMQLKLETQREKITGGAAETLDIQISDELGTRSYEMYSGGEAFRINFALRIALSQLLARRAGAHLRTVFIDEGFGTQDEDGRNKLIEAITAIQDTFDIILVVTHIDDLRDSFPVHIQVHKTSEGSYVSVR